METWDPIGYHQPWNLQPSECCWMVRSRSNDRVLFIHYDTIGRGCLGLEACMLHTMKASALTHWLWVNVVMLLCHMTSRSWSWQMVWTPMVSTNAFTPLPNDLNKIETSWNEQFLVMYCIICRTTHSETLDPCIHPCEIDWCKLRWFPLWTLLHVKKLFHVQFGY